MNKKLSLIILFLLFISLISVLLAFMAFSNGGSGGDVTQLKTGYDQLKNQVSQLQATTDTINSKVNSQSGNNVVNVNNQTTTANTTAPAAVQTPATTIPATPSTTQPQQTKTVSGNKVNMRSDASTSAKVVRQLPNGEQVTLTGNTSTTGGIHWVQVKDTKGNTGWIVASFVK